MFSPQHASIYYLLRALYSSYKVRSSASKGLLFCRKDDTVDAVEDVADKIKAN